MRLARGHAALGPGAIVGEIDQARGHLSGDQALVDAFAVAAGAMAPAEARTLLPKFGLGASHVLRPAATLSRVSGPEPRWRRCRRGVNLLVLDEPTNHLDLPAIERLESALASYAGTLLLVTHDRRMLEAVQLTRRIRVEAGRVTAERL